MRKKIWIGTSILAVATAVSINCLSDDKIENNLLLSNVEALAESEPNKEGITCYYINVFSSDAPYLLSCTTCEVEYGHGLPTATCPDE